MKLSIRTLIFAAAIAAPTSLKAAPVLVPNGDFETADGALWAEAGDPNTTFSYPSSGGAPGGYGEMTNNGDGFGVLVANEGEIPLGTLGLVAGESYMFTQSMTILSGDNIGGLKIEFYVAGDQVGNTGDRFVPLIGDGTTWETYSYQVAIPDGADAIKVVPLWGSDSSVGFDNVGVDNTPIELPPATLIPNGNFEIPGGADWGFFENGGHTVSYPSSGGNPGGFAQIDASEGGGFAGIGANNNAPISLDTLGLTAGETYTFTVDMKIISGPFIGKFKVEFVPTGTGDLTTSLIGDGSTWETYSFDITIPATSTQIIISPLWGTNSVIGYDNVDITIPVKNPLRADIEAGTVLTWVPEVPSNLFQAQRSFDEGEWEDFGPLLTGVTSTFDSEQALAYRIQELQLVSADANVNGGLETEDFSDPPCAESWVCLSSSGQPPTRITTDSHSGDASVRIAVVNDKDGIASNSEMQQNISMSGGTVTPGESYDFSFWAKQIGSGVSYVQQYRLQWLDAGDAILPGGFGFRNFAGGSNGWAEIAVPDLVAPENAATALIQIFGATGAVASAEAFGEVLIDDVSLTTTFLEPFETLEATPAPGVVISWTTEEGKAYQVQSSADATSFVDYGASITGDGERWTASDTITPSTKLFRVVETE